MLRQTCLTILYGSRPEVWTFGSHPQFWGIFQKNTNISPLKIPARTAQWTPVNLKASITTSDKRQKNTRVLNSIEYWIRTITRVPMKDEIYRSLKRQHSVTTPSSSSLWTLTVRSRSLSFLESDFTSKEPPINCPSETLTLLFRWNIVCFQWVGGAQGEVDRTIPLWPSSKLTLKKATKAVRLVPGCSPDCGKSYFFC